MALLILYNSNQSTVHTKLFHFLIVLFFFASVGQLRIARKSRQVENVLRDYRVTQAVQAHWPISVTLINRYSL